jgi:hypothetical protein
MMTRKYQKSILGTAICMLALSAITPFVDAQIPAPKQVHSLLAKHFPQTLIGECEDGEASPLTRGYTSIQWHNGDISIHGSDLQGKPWVAQIKVSPIAECQVWTSDLANNQQHDVLVLSMGIDSSGGWSSQLSLLIFDNQGRPFPWQAIGNFSADANGILEVVKSESKGVAEIVVAKQSGNIHSGFSYAYHRFGVTGSRIRKITHAQDGSTWPLIVSPTKNTNETEGRYDSSTISGGTGVAEDEDSSKSKIVRIENSDSMQDEHLVLSTKAVIGYPKIVMIDKPDGGRSIDFDPTQSEIEELKNNNAMVQSLGTECDRGNCQPLLLWAKE